MERLKKVLPTGWKSIPFGKVFEFLPTLTLSRNDLTTDNSITGIYNIHYGDIHSTYKYTLLDFEKSEGVPFISNEDLDESRLTFLKDGDLIIADASEDYAGVATAIELKNIGNRKVTAGLHTFAARDTKKHTIEGFRGYLLKHPWVCNEIKKLATGSKVYGVSKSNITNLELILPPLPEQQKIAQILYKWDELIEKQTQLIEVKEKRKKGLMQVLLTGKVRFKGFKDQWMVAKLVEITEYFGGAAFKSTDQVEKGIKWLKIANVGIGKTKWEETTFLPNSFVAEYPKYLLANGDVVMALTRPILNNKLKIAKICTVDDESLLNQRVAKLIPKKNNNLIYIYYLHQLPRIVDLINASIAGTDPPNIGLKELDSIDVKTPRKEEQDKIAFFLSAVDEEIQNLQNELEAFIFQKKGLIQQLLTGKIRVKL